jgi:hypothetical protein
MYYASDLEESIQASQGGEQLCLYRGPSFNLSFLNAFKGKLMMNLNACASLVSGKGTRSGPL